MHLADEIRVRGSASRGFRIPTFTELYYRDPANQDNPDPPETGWSPDGGPEWAHGHGWLSVSPYRRWDEDVIDWVKAAPADLWHSTNVRDVTTTGVETFVMRRWKSAFVRVHYAGLRVDAPDLTQLSKYVLEYARHQSGGSLTVPVVAGFRAAVNVDHRHRLDGQEYDLVGFRASKGFSARRDLFRRCQRLRRDVPRSRGRNDAGTVDVDRFPAAIAGRARRPLAQHRRAIDLHR